MEKKKISMLLQGFATTMLQVERQMTGCASFKNVMSLLG